MRMSTHGPRRNNGRRRWGVGFRGGHTSIRSTLSYSQSLKAKAAGPTQAMATCSDRSHLGS
jgi:hypothetical protein